MCLAIPGKVLEKFEENGLVMALIDYAGTRNQACLIYTPEADVGATVATAAAVGVAAGAAIGAVNRVRKSAHERAHETITPDDLSKV